MAENTTPIIEQSNTPNIDANNPGDTLPPMTPIESSIPAPAPTNRFSALMGGGIDKTVNSSLQQYQGRMAYRNKQSQFINLLKRGEGLADQVEKEAQEKYGKVMDAQGKPMISSYLPDRKLFVDPKTGYFDGLNWAKHAAVGIYQFEETYKAQLDQERQDKLTLATRGESGSVTPTPSAQGTPTATPAPETQGVTPITPAPGSAAASDIASGTPSVYPLTGEPGMKSPNQQAEYDASAANRNKEIVDNAANWDKAFPNPPTHEQATPAKPVIPSPAVTPITPVQATPAKPVEKAPAAEKQSSAQNIPKHIDSMTEVWVSLGGHNNDSALKEKIANAKTEADIRKSDEDVKKSEAEITKFSAEITNMIAERSQAKTTEEDKVAHDNIEDAFKQQELAWKIADAKAKNALDKAKQRLEAARIKVDKDNRNKLCLAELANAANIVKGQVTVANQDIVNYNKLLKSYQDADAASVKYGQTAQHTSEINALKKAIGDATTRAKDGNDAVESVSQQVQALINLDAPKGIEKPKPKGTLVPGQDYTIIPKK